MPVTLYYAHDPMCSWCWGFRPAWQTLQGQLPDNIQVRRLLGGLAPDDDSPMAEDMRRHLRKTWQHIQQRIPGTRFNFDFWETGKPRRSTYPACRAVVAAREQGAEHEEAMILAIQEAYYLQARNPSDAATLIELAQELGLDSGRFHQTLRDEATESALQQEIGACRAMRLNSFPSLLLQADDKRHEIALEYTDPQAMLQQIRKLAES